jgi:hypothetical protein
MVPRDEGWRASEEAIDVAKLWWVMQEVTLLIHRPQLSEGQLLAFIKGGRGENR